MTISRAFSADQSLAERVASNLATLDQRVDATGRDRASVRMVAVTKTFTAAHVAAAYDAGLRFFGENYVREFVDKRAACAFDARWHFLGALQTNKIPELAATADLLAGVARARELVVLGRQPRRPPVYLEIDFTGAPTRNGAHESEIESLLEVARSNDVEVRGLMTVAPHDLDGARRAFGALARRAGEFALPELSMGMSDDLEVALSLGSTEIRVGRALFGARQKP